MSDHADTIRRLAKDAPINPPTLKAHKERADALAWFDSVLAGRQQAIDERDRALRKAALIDLERERANEYQAQMSDMNTRLIEQRRRLHRLEDDRGRTVREAEARCEQAIDALRARDRYWIERIKEAEKQDAGYGLIIPGDSSLAVVLGSMEEAAYAGDPEFDSLVPPW